MVEVAKKEPAASRYRTWSIDLKAKALMWLLAQIVHEANDGLSVVRDSRDITKRSENEMLERVDCILSLIRMI
jgi:hypothetical protein